ncbi:MAG TPA: peptidyl-prolyl cis-trans isomerase [Methylomirabilota bacterium]|nr:peptidyl-prolyl cis-trans isomerase [Methylomirabilota bacterium]
MRRTSRYFLIAVVVTFIASLAYFGATQDRSGPEWVASVNGETISAVAYQQAYRDTVERYRQAFRERWSEEVERSLNLPDQVVERLVTERLLAQRATAEGLSVSDAELSDQITRIPAFREGGRFSRDRYLQLLARAGVTPAAFEANVRQDLLRQRLQALVTDGVRVSDAEGRQYWETERERVRAAYLQVAPEPVPAGFTASDAEIESYYQAHPAEFTLPERRRVLVALLSTASVPAPTPTDAEVEAAYQERRREFEQPARARVAHVLVRVPTVGGSQAEDQARAKADAVLQRVRGGGDFAQAARETSEDTGTAARGGDLGLIAPGELVPELDRAIFGLKAGEVAGPIRSPYGFHVIKVTEVMASTKRELKDVATTLRATLVAEGQLRALRDRAQEAQRALLGAKDFAGEAKRLGLTVREVGPITRTDAVEGVGRLPEATQAIWALAPDGVSPPVKTTDGYAIFRLLDRQDSRLPPLAEVREAVMRAVGRQKAQAAAQAKAAELAAAWRTDDDGRALARSAGAAFAEIGPFSRAEPLPDRELARILGPVALALKVGGVSDPTPAPAGLYVVKTLARERPDPAGFVAARSEVEARLLQEKRTQGWQGWLAGLRSGAKIEINRKVLPS